jgi:hypothetical protein
VSGSSVIDGDVDDGRGRLWKFVYEFLPSQISGKTIGSVGLTQQYLSSFATTTLLSPTRRRKFTAPTAHYAYKGERGIKAASNTSVTKYFPFTNATQTLTVDGVTAGSYYAAGYNADDERAYIHVYSPTANLRKIYEFEDDTFSTLLNAYLFAPSSGSLYSASVFAVKNGKAWYYYNGWKYADFVNNGAEVSVTSPACSYNATLYNSYAYSVLVKNNKLFGFRDIYSSGTRIPIIDLETETQIATMGTSLRASGTGTYYTAALLDPSSENSPILPGLAAGSPANIFGLKQALTCCAMPPDAPLPPSGSGVVVTYQVSVSY